MSTQIDNPCIFGSITRGGGSGHSAAVYFVTGLNATRRLPQTLKEHDLSFGSASSGEPHWSLDILGVYNFRDVWRRNGDASFPTLDRGFLHLHENGLVTRRNRKQAIENVSA